MSSIGMRWLMRKATDPITDELVRLRRIAWAAEEEAKRLRAALRDVIFDLHNCRFGGDMPRCEHITEALKIARETLASDKAS